MQGKGTKRSKEIKTTLLHQCENYTILCEETLTTTILVRAMQRSTFQQISAWQGMETYSGPLQHTTGCCRSAVLFSYGCCFSFRL